MVAIRATVEDARRYLAISDTRTVERDIGLTASKYGISYIKAATIEDEFVMVSAPQGPMIYEGRLVRMRVGLKSVLKGRKWGKRGGKAGEGELAKVEEKEKDSAEVIKSPVSDASDSGVSMAGEESSDEWIYGDGEVVGSRSFDEVCGLVWNLMELDSSMPRF